MLEALELLNRLNSHFPNNVISMYALGGDILVIRMAWIGDDASVRNISYCISKINLQRNQLSANQFFLNVVRALEARISGGLDPKGQ